MTIAFRLCVVALLTLGFAALPKAQQTPLDRGIQNLKVIARTSPRQMHRRTRKVTWSPLPGRSTRPMGSREIPAASSWS